VMALRFAEERPLDGEVRDLAVAIAGQCAQALERARLFEAEQAARAEAEGLAKRLQIAQAVGGIGTFVWDIASGSVAWTPELEALYGLPPGGFAGRYENWRRAIHPEDTERADQDVQAAAGTGTLDTNFRIVRPDGTVRHLLAHGRVIRDDAGRAQMIGVNVDVTEREEALAAAEAAVRARDVFLSIAAHELRTPITALKGSAQLLVRQQERGTLDPARLTRTLGVLNGAADRLAALTDDLLDVSRIRTGQLPLTIAPLDLPTLVREAVARARERHSGAHQLVLDLPAGLPPVPGDAARLDQVLTNLLDNAIKYSPAGGHVTVTMRPAEGGILTTVRDEGIGLPPESIEAIFEPFGRAPNAARSQLPGLGLGLYICRSIVERHNGRIWAESAGEEQGTTIALWLPAGEATARD
jgi:PAS domain S-box-containing protein